MNSNAEKNVFFNELLFCALRREFFNLVRRNEYIRIKENETRAKLHSMAEVAQKRYYRTTRVRAYIN